MSQLDSKRFMPGLNLSRAFHDEIVGPILREAFPRLSYSAALIGGGSEVLGYDSERSTDHHWGPRLLLFLSEADYEQQRYSLGEVLAKRLPPAFRGFSTNFGPPDEFGVRLPVAVEHGPIAHHVDVQVVRAFLSRELGFDPRQGITVLDWLLTPSQRLLHVTSGAVYHDGLQELEPLRAKLQWYPDDIWFYLIAGQWQRISQEEAFVGRCGEAGDELGSRLVAGRLVRDLMKLCFLFERRYAPYSKWLGTAFATLRHGPALVPLFDQVLAACEWHDRERRIAYAYEQIAGLHNELSITRFVDPATRPYYNRPYRVLHAGRFVEATREAIGDGNVRRIMREAGDIGAIDQFVDNSDILSVPDRARQMGHIFQGLTHDPGGHHPSFLH